jgi:hypothetical protein
LRTGTDASMAPPRLTGLLQVKNTKPANKTTSQENFPTKFFIQTSGMLTIYHKLEKNTKPKKNS